MFSFLTQKHQFNWPSWTPERWFLTLALIFGGILTVIVPPQKGPDEWAHFFRAYQISNLQVMSTLNSDGSYGGMLPRSLVQTNIILTQDNVLNNYNQKYTLGEEKRVLKIPLNTMDRIEANFSSTGSYSPIAYLAPALAMEPAKILNLPPVIVLLSGRLGCLLGWCALIFWAIRVIPIAKWTVVALALIPVSLFQASVISADSVTNGLAVLVVAYILRFWQVAEPIRRKTIVIFGVLLVLLALAKPTYAILSLLVFIVPGLNFGSRKVASISKATLIATCLIAGADWQVAVHPISAYALTQFADPTVTVSQSKQFAVVRANPWSYGILVANYMFLPSGDAFYESSVGVLGSYDIPLPIWIIFWVWLVIAITLMSSRARLDESHWTLIFKKLFVAGMIAGNIVLIFTAIYFAYTPVGWNIIYGLQGRYLIAVTALLIPLSLTRTPLLKIEDGRLTRFIVGSYGAILSYTIAAVFFRYFLDFTIPQLNR